MKNYYSILGVPPTANQQDIRKAYREKAKLYHPDVNKNNDAHKIFIDIGEAYEILYNSDTRKQYDDFLRNGTYSSQASSSNGFSSQQNKARQKAEEYAKMSLADLLNGILDLAYLATKTVVVGQKGVWLDIGDYISLGLKGTVLLICLGLLFTGIGTIPGAAIGLLTSRSLFKNGKFIGIGPLLISTVTMVCAIGFFVLKLLY